MIKLERQNYIMDKLLTEGSILIVNLCKDLNCSDQTIRRDLQEMEEAGKLKRTHGGAYLISSEDDKGAPISLRAQLIPDEKRHIGIIAAHNFIQPDDIIMIDSSTTCLSLAETIINMHIPVTIITNSHNIVSLFNKNNMTAKLIVIGGIYKERSRSFVGPTAISQIQGFYADKAFISCSALDQNLGMLDSYIQQKYVREAMLTHSKKRYLLADNTKFDDDGNFLIHDFSILDGIITNSKPSDDWLNIFASNNLQFLWKDNDVY
ncbi:hypothetical protein BXO88_06180 [Oribacterium sp. C9]|uniref:DeoR/GlpR family DNA-binding transcription regulator n=1 Tax=Oribacterium sp. C9 TaxID=1943579 RepID=UPI0009D263AB|nr:DeoR/GlpR family DNA-binding transcription regulator [Oribacterium sp. C9]OON86846.1 hypothetical protein BXO88_06180 [Oribacterium sp. C9]